MKTEKIIIDTDPGVDDAIAIAFGIKASLPIESIATVYGNSTLDNCSKNALTILEVANSDIPVYRGAEKPMNGEGKLAHSHGDNGLGGFTKETRKTLETQSALEHYQDVLSSSEYGDVTIVAVGPTTNIGQLAKDSPELFKKAGKIIIMGGVIGEVGNVTPFAEFNVYNDPYSLHEVLTSGHTNIIIVPANVCRQVTFTQEIFDQIADPELADDLAQITKLFIEYYTKDPEYGGFSGGVMYDLLAVALLADESLFDTERVSVRVETDAVNERFGLTEVADEESNCSLVTSVNVEGLKNLFVREMNNKVRTPFVFLDIDGTLLDPKYRFNVENPQKVFARLTQQGWQFALNSNRSVEDILPLYEELGLSGVLVGENGAFLYHPDTKRYEYLISDEQRAYSAELKERLPEIVTDITRRLFDTSAIWETADTVKAAKEGNIGDNLATGEIVILNNAFRKFSASMHFKTVQDSELVAIDAERLSQITEELRTTLETEPFPLGVISSPVFGNVVVNFASPTKKNGVEKITDTLKQRYEFYFIGDEAGDYQMSEGLGHFLTVGNAESNLKSVAEVAAQERYLQGTFQCLDWIEERHRNT